MKEILCISSYPPRECGIATFTDDLVRAVHQKFGTSYAFRVCALESENEKHVYDPIVKYTLDTSSEIAYTSVANLVEQDADIELVLVQHEFGLFHGQEDVFLQFLKRISQPKVIVFHTVLSCPGKDLQVYLQQVARACEAVIVMTQHSSNILQEDYHIPGEKNTCNPTRDSFGLAAGSKDFKGKIRGSRPESPHDFRSVECREKYRNHDRSIA